MKQDPMLQQMLPVYVSNLGMLSFCEEVKAFYSNQILVKSFKETLSANGYSPYSIQFVDDTSHAVADQMMRLNKYLDVLIPRGGANLIRRVKETATVPVIETGTGNNHIFIDKDAQLPMAVDIVVNAKTQRPSVCEMQSKRSSFIKVVQQTFYLY